MFVFGESVAVTYTRIMNAPWLLSQINKILSSTVEYDNREIGVEGRAGDRADVTLQLAFRRNLQRKINIVAHSSQ